MVHYSCQQKVLFQHCDPAGIVFYPRYFEMINAAVESWFEEGLKVPFAVLHMERGSAIPTVTIETTFVAPSHLGDILTLGLTVQKMGKASLDLMVTGAANANKRFESNLTLVHINREEETPCPWPNDIRHTIETLLKETS